MMLLMLAFVIHLINCQNQYTETISSLGRTRFGKRDYETRESDSPYNIHQKTPFKTFGSQYNPSFRERFNGDQQDFQRYLKNSHAHQAKQVRSSERNDEAEKHEKRMSRDRAIKYLAQKDNEKVVDGIQNYENRGANVVPLSRFGRNIDLISIKK
nr:uncharacterized protein LOC100198437 [Hydra vulgaris]XP_012555462.1 uncharacterized protein LOC100198437 [Hydra vulgaris]XP_012555463.1 uncharacterized protein LOC100198437 [Hydra vulgaris]